jgi:hypothetical protein
MAACKMRLSQPSGLGDNRNLRAWHPPKLRCEGRCVDPKLLHRVHRDQALRTAEGRQARQGSSRALEKAVSSGRRIVRAYPIYCEVVGIGALSINAELALRYITRRHGHRLRSEQDERLKTPAVQGQVLDEELVNYRAYCRVLCLANGAALSTVTVSEAGAGTISKFISARSPMCRITPDLRMVLNPSFSAWIR